MYNRYIRNDAGGYTRVSQEDSGTQHRQATKPDSFPRQESNPQDPSPPPPSSSKNSRGQSGPDGPPSGSLRHLLNQLKLDRIDSGDLLLLGLLFFLFREKADEELLVSLGLLLIL